MTRNIIIAAVLATIVIAASYYFQFRSNPGTVVDTPRETQSIPPGETSAQNLLDTFPLAVGDAPLASGDVIYQNDVMRVVFDTKGASIRTVELSAYTHEGQALQIIVNQENYPSLFDMFFGPQRMLLAEEFFVQRSLDGRRVSFSRDFSLNGGDPFTIMKHYTFHPGEYLFEVEIEFKNSVNDYLPLDYEGFSYGVYAGPQIGPAFEKLDQRNDYRKFSTLRRNSKKDVKVAEGGSTVLEERVSWMGVLSKYFGLVLVPGIPEYRATLERSGAGSNETHQIYIERPVLRSSVASDVYRVYLGPKTKKSLARYNDSDHNAFQIDSANLDKAVDTRVLFGWLESILKFIMQILYRLIPNYGIAIILLTVVVKIALLPLTLKGQKSMTRMQQLNPQIQEIRTRLKDEPEQMNREIAELYKREKINPAGGCLPLLIQFPFFLAMFGLFNNDFALRGAVFIPGWISDLSAPESVFSFGFTVPVIGWTDIRLLPIIFLASQFLTFFLNPTPQAQQSGAQAILFKYGLPIFFFFILYNMPSGLLVYWISSNLLTIAQQYATKTLMNKDVK